LAAAILNIGHSLKYNGTEGFGYTFVIMHPPVVQRRGPGGVVLASEPVGKHLK
jgi:hypothetical protein